jgi:molybdenum cofactor cytidylyltransferase
MNAETHTLEGLAGAARTGIVILAAGASTRMGQPKQLLVHREQTLLQRAVETALAAACGQVVVVLGAHEELVRQQLRRLPVMIATNEEWWVGMSSSIRTGLAALLATRPELEAVVIMLCDQPFVTSGLIDELRATHRRTGKPIVASAYGGGFGVPALFDKTMFGKLAELNGNEGARKLIAAHADAVATVSFPQAVMDVDTPQDFVLLQTIDSAVPTTAGK